MSTAAQRLISDCRALASEYQGNMQRLTAHAEAAARLRHLRLHSIADAEIPKIGAGRKQTLADHNIFTAADVEEYVVRRIKGFGDVLTGHVMAWKEGVLRQFRFNAAAAVSAAEQRAVTLKYQTRQQQVFSGLERGMNELERLAPACQAALRQMDPDLRRLAAAFYQAEADLDVFAGRRWWSGA